jgi:hypothetical protein
MWDVQILDTRLHVWLNFVHWCPELWSGLRISGKICACPEWDEVIDDLLKEDEFDFNSESAFSGDSEVNVKYLSCDEQTDDPVIRSIW